MWRPHAGEGGVFYGIYEPGGTLVGVVDFVVSGFDGQPDLGYVSLIMIANRFRGKGIGGEVVNLVEKACRQELHVTGIRASVQVNNPDALRFWRNNGHRVIGGPELRPDQTTVFHLEKDLSDQAQ